MSFYHPNTHNHKPSLNPIHSKPSPFHMYRQPETQPISEEQLIDEVRRIYAGLVMVEKNCVEIDQHTRCISKLSSQHWKAFLALHRTLLHEHHDFFLASQHPSASRVLKNLPFKYAMTARMWRRGIHSFLGLLSRCLPNSPDQMLYSINPVYSITRVPMDGTPSIDDAWIECLGDLARYRMAVEEKWIKWFGDPVRYRMAVEDPRIECLGDLVRYRMSVEIPGMGHREDSQNVAAAVAQRRYNIVAILALINFPQHLFYFKSLANIYIPRNSLYTSLITFLDGLGPHHRQTHIPLLSTEADYYQCQLGVKFDGNEAARLSPKLLIHASDLRSNYLFYSIESFDLGNYVAQLFARLPLFLPFSFDGRWFKGHQHDWVDSRSAGIVSSNTNWIIDQAVQQFCCSLKLSSLLIVLIFSSCCSAYPANQAEHKDTKPNPNGLSSDDVILIVFAILSVPICFLLGQRRGQARAFGTSMVALNIANLMTGSDPLISPVGHWVALGLSFTFTAIFAGLLAKRFPHITRSLAHTIGFLTVVWIVNYLLNQSSGSGGSGGDQSDSSCHFLLFSIAFTLICWWKVADSSAPPPILEEGNIPGSIPLSMSRPSRN
ncbi:hypothetical protein ACO22_01612 [Paracoccidioides brasiliensis]|uniref:Uncharacterized protein n=1 Tax=Paracoccidioides brasiliensis TaxID=121759 RepID=A0A1D2JLA7_PARBR|nr:hypothetical protein ACO22_01612 [Paracoccidioides brasiliensis]